MRRVLPIFVLIAASAGLALGVQPQSAQPTSPDQAQMPPGHPAVPPVNPDEPQMPPGHPAVQPAQPDDEYTMPPPADPADVASIDAIVGAYYDSISGPKGQVRDWDRFRSLFAPPARMVASRPNNHGGAGLWPLTPEDFITFNSKYFEGGGYFESEVARRIEQFGNIAHVWSTYESRQFAEQLEPYSRGIYSIQLLKDGDRWWIVTMYWDYEREDAPIPEKYLETP